MYKNLFRTRYGALGFVAFTLISVTSLVGTDGESGLIQYGIDSFTTQRDALGEEAGRLDQSQDKKVRRVGAPEPTYDEISDEDESFDDEGEDNWGSDEDLVDDTAGFDPAPIVATEYNPEEGEIVEVVVGGGRGPMMQGDDE